MSEDKNVVNSVLAHLYQRIDSPTAVDARLLAVAHKALDQMEPPPAPFDYDVLSMADARKAVESGLIGRNEALVKERAGKNRAKLVTWLEKGDD